MGSGRLIEGVDRLLLAMLNLEHGLVAALVKRLKLVPGGVLERLDGLVLRLLKLVLVLPCGGIESRQEPLPGLLKGLLAFLHLGEVVLGAVGAVGEVGEGIALSGSALGAGVGVVLVADGISNLAGRMIEGVEVVAEATGNQELAGVMHARADEASSIVPHGIGHLASAVVGGDGGVRTTSASGAA